MYIVFGLFVACFSFVHADHCTDIDELRTLFGRKIQQLESHLEKEKVKTNEINRQLRELESKLDILEKREQHNSRSKRQVVGSVAFSAYLNSDVINLSPGRTIQFQGVVLNDENAYNKYTGVFTVPLDGVYFLPFTAEDLQPRRELLNLVADGQLISSTVFERTSGGNGHRVGGYTVLARLRKSQSVWVAVDSREKPGGSLQGSDVGRFTTFSGFYLYE
ncbi:complement C1q tumor necrosis factor-related protein 3-like [Dreissena polymorpha]|uniref:complement C1q tumor necrosis factor-related protein 3-like n=1 Tax=Dreissena polymorpha TaxID=45954 RepID=UPI002264AC6D|nr:complement C1q tumor necrosis factor-related protein 3-like [Dreissena polymorpha]